MPSRPKKVINISDPSLTGILTAFNSNTKSEDRTYVQSDGGTVDYLFVEETGNETGDIHRALDLTGYVIEEAIGSINAAPTDGAFSLGYDGDFGGLNDLAYNISEVDMQAAFDANSTIGAGGVVVTKYGNAYEIRFTTIGAKELIAVSDDSQLVPESGVFITRTHTGDGSTVEIQWIRVVQSPIAYTNVFTPSTTGQVDVTRLQTGSATVKEVQRIALSVPATSGSFVVNLTTVQEFKIICVADVAGNLDLTGIICEDANGTVGIVMKHGGGGTAPAEILACTRVIEITATANDDTATAIATAWQASVDGDAQFVATRVGNVVTVRQLSGGARNAPTDVDTGFTLTPVATGVLVSASVPVGASGEVMGAALGGVVSVLLTGTNQWDITFPATGTQDLITVAADPLFQIIYTATLDLNTTAAFQKFYSTGGDDPIDLVHEISIKAPGEGPITVIHEDIEVVWDLIQDNLSGPSQIPQGLTAGDGIYFAGGVTGYTGGGSTNLDGFMSTVGLTVPRLVAFVHATAGFKIYRLKSGTTAESSPDIIRPDDYAASTNEKVYELVDLTRAMLESAGIVTKYKASDTSRASTTTPAADPDLTFAVAANEVWEFEFHVFISTTADGATPGFRYGLDGPAAPTGIVFQANGGGQSFVAATSSVPFPQGAFAQNMANHVYTGQPNWNWVIIKGMLRNGANAGDVALYWAQTTSSGTAIVVKAGSYVKARKVN